MDFYPHCQYQQIKLFDNFCGKDWLTLIYMMLQLWRRERIGVTETFLV